jgi:hypothetical protein
MKPRDIELHIDEIVLDGLPQVDRARFGGALQSELTRLIAERGLPQSLQQGGVISQLNGGQFEVAPGSTEKAIAGQVARSVYGGFGE